MPKSTQSPRLPAEIRRMLSALRWRIRGYVWLQGLALAGIWVGATFWAALAMDYLPVLVGASEMPRPARGVLLVVIAAVLAWILYRSVLRRTLVRMADRSMAILLERQFDGFRDSLITSVELGGRGVASSTLQGQMLAETERMAVDRLGEVRLGRVLNLRPLFASVIAAGCLLAPAGVFYAVNASAFQLGVERLYLLSRALWPRNAEIEVLGVEVRRATSTAPTSAPPVLPFQDRRVKVARGSDVRLVVRAEATAHLVPDVCTVYYRTQEGDRGRVNMTRVGRMREGFQEYRYDGKPLRGILSNVVFDVVGFDDRVAGLVIEALDSPAVVDCQLDCVFPDYLVDERLSLWQPRTVPVTAGTKLPQGTRATLRGASSKDLSEVHILDTGAQQSTLLRAGEEIAGRRTFAFPIPRLDQNLALEISLTDTERIASDRPHHVFVQSVADTPPVVEIGLHGVGTAVTADVLIRVRGRIVDDYQLARSWIEIATGQLAARQYPISVSANGDVQGQLDFREQRSLDAGLTIHPKDKLSLVVKASDRFNLAGEPHIGSGDHYELEVVTPDELLALLEAREINLRRRFEQIIEETTGTRDMLLRVQTDRPGQTSGQDPEDAKPKGDGAQADSVQAAVGRQESLRLLRAQQAVVQSQKSAQEVLGVAASFRDIREELIANRVDTEDRKQRLQEKIAEPLEKIGTKMFPELDRRVERLVAVLNKAAPATPVKEPAEAEPAAAAQRAVEQANAILVAMQNVLQDMLDVETYNELLDLVRGLIEDQERLIGDTKKLQKKQVLELLK